VLRLCANISTLFNELPPLERPAAAAAAGFAAVEMQFPYALARNDLASACHAAAVEVVLLNMPAGDISAGELGLAGLPGREADFADAVQRSVDYSLALGCTRVNCLVGNLPHGQSQSCCWKVLVENLRVAADRMARHGILLVTEVLNAIDFPRFQLTISSDGDALIDAVGHANLKLQYDVYHRRAAGDDWLGGLAKRIGRVGHIQFSDYPGRHEPGTGELDIARLFNTIATLPYEGWTGCEYRPTGATADSFGWRALISSAERK
jgi:hydroxypyruvate isomerase